MTTKTSALKPATKININAFLATVLDNFSDSIVEMVVTIAVTGMTLAYMSVVFPIVLVNLISGYYIAAMLIIALIRVVQRFDDSATTSEVDEHLVQLEASLEDKLNEMITAQNERDTDFYNSVNAKIETIIRLNMNNRNE